MSEDKKYKLVIVESPGKISSIQGYLGKEFKVIASKGHIFDLPKKDLGIDIHNEFKQELVVMEGKEDTVKNIKKMADGASEVYLASDADREGEAIAFHLKKAVGKKANTFRIKFTSISKESLKEAVENPTILNDNMYESQKTRRVLDRLVGYMISPILWTKLKSGLSAGRVQSVALRVVVEREDEIRNFKPEEWYDITAFLKHNEGILKAKFFGLSKDKKHLINTKEEADNILEKIKNKKFEIVDCEKKTKEKKPTPPFTTSKLQQEADAKLKFSGKHTMQLAQKLYEGKDLGEFGTHGLITYMRTDSVRTDAAALANLREYLKKEFSAEYISPEVVLYGESSSKKDSKVQDAHEAIRPVSLEYTPEKIKKYLSDDEFLLYSLIWKKYIASQMSQALIDQTTYISKPENEELYFKTSGSVISFLGYKKVYEEATKEKVSKKGESEDESSEGSSESLPIIPLNEMLGQSKEALKKDQRTSPPPRYNQGTLIAVLEEKGIGRPATYVPILENIVSKGYIETFQSRFKPTDLGEVLCKMLIKAFPMQMDIKFTAKMEKQLDLIESGETTSLEVLTEFWKDFQQSLENANKNLQDIKPKGIPTGLKCPQCENGKLNFEWRRELTFLNCNRCSYSQKSKKISFGKFEAVALDEGQKSCAKCGGVMGLREGKFGKFFACLNYPQCKHTLPFTTGIKCPVCQAGEFVEKIGQKNNKKFWGCSMFPKCNNVIWNEPVSQRCLFCSYTVLEKRNGKIYCVSCKKENNPV